MKDKRVRLGIVLGLLAAPLMFAGRGAGAGAAETLSDCDGRIREIVIQYVPGAGPPAGRAWREFLGALPADVIVHAVVPDRAAFRELRETIGDVPPRLEPVETGHAMTFWARDRWLALRTGDGTRLLLPAEEDGSEIWRERAGDARIGVDLADSLDDVEAGRSALGFDGGDFVADAETVFVTPRVTVRNGGHRLAEALEAALGKRVVLLDLAPPYHAGMYMMTAGDGRVVVGDPSLAAPLFAGKPDPNPVGSDFSGATQERFDAVARQCAEAGYAVTRMPVLPGKDGRTWLTPLNVVIDEREGGRIVYMPTYRHAPGLNDAAARVWAGLGFTVCRVDCTETYPLFGSLRCLVGVLVRSSSSR